jgi:hypothetical protein
MYQFGLLHSRFNVTPMTGPRAPGAAIGPRSAT